MESKIFNKGDFVKYCVYTSTQQPKVTFGIFEGVDLAPEYQYTKKLSLAAYYDSYKYSNNLDNGVGWGYAPSLEVSKGNKPCEKTIDTLEENSWWKLCTQEEKEKAIEILAKYGYEWNEELLAIIDINTKEIVHKIIIPKIEYNGEIIKPSCDEFKHKLKKAIADKVKTSNNYGCAYGGYNYDNEMWD